MKTKMKKVSFISIFLMMTASAIVAQPSMRPESAIPTPAEKAMVSQDAPALGAKESEDWQRLRAERRQAREQILSDLRSSTAAEKKSIRQDVAKDKAPRPHSEGEMPNNSRDQRPNFEHPGFVPMYPGMFPGMYPGMMPGRDFPSGPNPDKRPDPNQ